TAYELGLGIPAEPLFRSPDTNKIPKHLFQGYLNIYNNYFKAPWMPDRTEANPNELNQDDARYGFRCCHLKNISTAPLPPETALSRQMTSTTSLHDALPISSWKRWRSTFPPPKPIAPSSTCSGVRRSCRLRRAR